MAPSTPTTTANPETALQAWEPRAVAILEEYPESKFNVLVPTVAVRQVNPYLVPDIEVVQLSTDESKGEIYHDSQMKDGHYAPTAKGLSRIAQVAGIDVLDSRRIDDGRDPDVVEWSVLVEMSLPSGARIRRPGSKRIDLHQLSQQRDREGKPWSAARLAKAREHLLANAETKALNRAIRSILSLQGSMPKAQLAKPFAVLRWVPNMSDPDVRRRMLDNLLPATTAIYGPGEPRRVGPGSPEVIEVAEASAQEADGEYRELPDGRRVDRSTGEISDEPDWFGEAGGNEAGLVDRLRQVATASRRKGDATAEQREGLKEALRGITTPDAMAVLLEAFELAALPAISAAQAQAILDLADELGPDGLRELWRTTAAELAA